MDDTLKFIKEGAVMVREIIKDTFFLRQKSENADKSDLNVAMDLMDTLKANADRCVGLAANMIGVRKRILAVNADKAFIVMLNPVITGHSKAMYEAEEGCLSLTGTRKALRYESITVEYTDMHMKKKTKSFSGFSAQIIQHEMDHFEGIII